MTQSPDAYPGRPLVPGIVLLAAAARTVTGTGEAVTLEGFLALVLQLEVTAAATESSDTLDVYLQTTLDGGSSWVDVYHFTQVLGNGGAKKYFGKIVADAALTEFENGAALGAAAGRAIFGSSYRVRWAITDASTQNASFTFSVKANGT